ncbi:MAG TPA: hypothetical protein DCE41_28025 [Cytophagales bacterium]|nr:hypothetical protein [Cytophagales bacterium]HAA18297.1 hypothetical protein [Cytophagales bacterium]HAP63882.1 hypothetical protein [Cytophagales bacterium]
MFPRLTPAVRSILLINVVVFFASSILGLDDALASFAALAPLSSKDFFPSQFITYMFLHGNLRHLFGNMLMLFFFGSWVEQVWGAQRFLIFYLICGLGAGVLYASINYVEYQGMRQEYESVRNHPTPSGILGFVGEYGDPSYGQDYQILNQYDEHPEDPIAERNAILLMDNWFSARKNYGRMLGASGAVFGVLLALGMLFPNHTVMLIIPPIPVKIKYLVGFLGIAEYFAILRATPGDNVAHNAHLAGMLIAFLLIRFGNFGGNR